MVHRRFLGAGWLPFWVACLAAAPASFAASTGHCATNTLRVGAGETRSGDHYVFSERAVSIEGTLEGDLVGLATSVQITGTVTGDVIAGAQSVVLDGAVTDTVRVFTNNLTVNGTVEGDLLAFAQSVILGPNARVHGDLLAFAQTVSLAGTVDGDVKVTGGQIELSGPVGGSVRAEGEDVLVTESARVAGELVYKAREPIEVPPGTVAGTVRFEPEREDDEEEEDEGSVVGSVLAWIWWCGASLVVGFVLLAAFRRAGPRVAATVGQDALGSLGVGFVTAVVVPVASMLICLLILTIPLAVLVLLVYFPVLYVAKLPVAAWAGLWLLHRAGAKSAGAGKGLLVGVPLLYLLFEIPYLGTVVWFVALFVGLGAIILGARAHAKERSQRDPASGAAAALPVAP